MRSWTIVRIMGIPIRINITLLVFLPVLAWVISREDYLETNIAILEAIGPHQFDLAVLGDGTTPWIIGFAAAIGLFVGVTFHELGHAWTAMRYEIGISSITLWIFGGLARLEDIPEEWDVEFWIAIAGPITSVLFAAVAYAVFLLLPSGSGQIALFVIGWLAMINVVLAVFNMLPAFPMDGGRILRALLARRRPYVDATRTAAAIGKGFAVAMAIFGILAFAPLLVLISMFVYIAATGESRATVLRDLLRGVTVERVMRPPTEAITADTTVQGALDEMFRSRVTGFPVIDESGDYVGVVSLGEIRDVEETARSTTTVGDVARRDLPTVASTDDVFDVLQQFSSTRSDRIAVVSGTQLVGFVSHQDVLSAIEIFQGLKSGKPDVMPGSGYP